jgi:hypothetical protein
MKSNKGIIIGFVVVVVCLVLGASSSQAMPVLGANVYVSTTGDVIAEFLGSDAGYNNLLYLESPANSLGLIFEGHATPVGTTFNLGSYTAGTELIFRMRSGGGYDYYTGPASRNPDGLAHAVVDDAYAPGKTYVGFEDMFGGGDRDYNDITYAFSNVQITPPPITSVPDMAATLRLLASSFFGLAALSRRLRK